MQKFKKKGGDKLGQGVGVICLNCIFPETHPENFPDLYENSKFPNSEGLETISSLFESKESYKNLPFNSVCFVVL